MENRAGNVRCATFVKDDPSRSCESGGIGRGLAYGKRGARHCTYNSVTGDAAGRRTEETMLRMAMTLWVVAGAVACAQAADIGQVKVSRGEVTIDRAGQSLPGESGARLQTSDVVRTGSNGTVGITMTDNSL